jgi:site-specific recombinase XerD
MRGESHTEMFISELQLKNYSQQTVKNYKCAVLNFLSAFNIPPKSISQNQIKAYLKESSSVSDLKNKISALKFFYKKIIKQPLKFRYIEYPRGEKKLPKVINHNDLVTKIRNISNLKHKAILSLAYCCGLRVSEIINIKLEHIDGKQRIILIAQAKGNKDRYVPVSENVLMLLRDYFKEYRPKVFLFNGQFSDQYSIKSCQQIFKKYIDKKHSFHHLRHSAFTTMLESGVDLRVIQTVAGHTSPKTTAIYTHVSQKFLASIQTPI